MTTSMGSRWRVGEWESPSAARRRATRPAVREPNDSAWMPVNGKSLRSASAWWTRRRATTMATPTTSTMIEMISGRFTPCHSVRCVSAYSPPRTVRATESSGPSSIGPMRNASGSDSTPGTAAGSHRATGASRTSDMSRVPSMKAPKIRRAE